MVSVARKFSLVTFFVVVGNVISSEFISGPRNKFLFIYFLIRIVLIIEV